MIISRTLFLATLVSLATWVSAQPSLSEQLRLLDKQIAAEQHQLNQTQQKLEQSQTTLKKEQGKLAGELFDLELKRQQLKKQQTDLTQQHTLVTRLADDLTSQKTQIQYLLKQQVEQLNLELREIPGQSAQRQIIKNILENKDDWEVKQTQKVLDLLKFVHQQASQIATQTIELHTADGIEQVAILLSLGHCAFAYKIQDANAVGLAMSAPEDASGYRWSEDLSPKVRASLDDVFAQLENGQSANSILQMPLDVTRRLRPGQSIKHKTLKEQIVEGGFIMIPMFVFTILALLMIFERGITLYIRNGKGSQQALSIIKAVMTGDLKQANELSSKANSAIARTLHACLSRSEMGTHAMEDAIQEQLLHEIPKLQRFLGGIAIFAAVAPLLGLLGTVTGIIRTFGVVQSFGNANPSLMAGGISEALVTTAAGLIIAIPLLLMHSLLKGRVQTIISGAEKHAATLLNILTYKQSDRHKSN